MKRMLQSLTGNIKKKVNQHDEEDISALHYASRYNHYAIVKLLVEFGASEFPVSCYFSKHAKEEPQYSYFLFY